jgi:sugar phosphate isomerase/epimerase
VYVACSTFSFGRSTLEQSLQTIREMQFAKADLAIHDSSPHITPSDVIADGSRIAQRLKSSNLPLAAFHVDFASTDANHSKAVLRAMLAVETHSATLTADPLGALELCRRIPGLGITLDPSHYLAGPHGNCNYDALFPYVRHVRLRDTGSKPEEFQVRVGQGQLEYGRVISMLEKHHYDRALTVDIRDVPDGPFPVEPEVRKLKYLLESLCE